MPRTTLISLAILLAFAGCREDAPTTVAATSQPASQPATMPATAPAAVPLKSLVDVVRASNPKFPVAEPLRESLELSASARLRLNEPTYLCSRGDLWITHDGALPTIEALAAAPKLQTHVTRELVRFVYWRPISEPWTPELVVADGPGEAWVTATARMPLEHSLTRDWPRAGSWNTNQIQAAVVPTSTGVSVIRVIDNAVREDHVELCAATPGASTQYTLDTRGLLAWSIDPTGPSKVARYLDGKWTMLTPSDEWPSSVVQVVPFQDGTLLVISQEAATLRLKSILLEAIEVDETRVQALVKQLVNRDPKERERGQADLAQIGPGAWPILRRLQPGQPPEARIRIRAVLGNETTPSLGGITPVSGPARVVCRLPDGSVVVRFDAGASAVNANGVVQSFAPAWLAIGHTRPAERVPDSLNEDLATPGVRLTAWSGEWIVEHDVDGPKRWMGNHTEPMLRKSETAEFKRFAGIDAMGRWIFKTDVATGPTLIIDPTLPDPKPRLPVWTIDVQSNTVGWNTDDWPVMRRGDAWVLRESAWQTMKRDVVEAEFRTALPAKPDLSTTPATAPATAPTTDAAATPEPLLVDADGNRYFDGRESLIVETKDGRRLSWLLPPEAAGPGIINDSAVLLEAEGKLFLCNSPGRLQRLTKQLDAAEPFALDAIFTRHIPGTDIRRFWKDPAGRLVFASGGNKLSVCFPSGRISNSMSHMIPAAALRKAMEEEAPK